VCNLCKNDPIAILLFRRIERLVGGDNQVMNRRSFGTGFYADADGQFQIDCPRLENSRFRGRSGPFGHMVCTFFTGVRQDHSKLFTTVLEEKIILPYRVMSNVPNLL